MSPGIPLWIHTCCFHFQTCSPCGEIFTLKFCSYAIPDTHISPLFFTEPIKRTGFNSQCMFAVLTNEGHTREWIDLFAGHAGFYPADKDLGNFEYHHLLLDAHRILSWNDENTTRREHSGVQRSLRKESLRGGGSYSQF